MQQHPVPRDIIGFRFKLIGEMTIKQFAYLAVGVVVGYLLFRSLPLPGAVRLAIGILFAGGGAALAFVPLQGRPLDTWIKAYLKSVYSPTQFMWRKQNPPPKILGQPAKTKRHLKKTSQASKAQPAEPDKQLSRKRYEEVEQKLSSYLKKVEKKPHEALDKREQKALKQTETVMQKTGSGTQKNSYLASRPASSPARGESTGQEREVRGETDEVKKSRDQDVSPQSTTKATSVSNIPPRTAQTPPQSATSTPPTSHISPPTPQVEEAIRTRVKKELEQQYKEELERLKREKAQIEQKMKKLATPSFNNQSHLRILSQAEATEAGFPLYTKQPNVIIGTTVDSQQQQLPGILVTIKNKDGRIVRALKTNNLGQFVSSTPLPNGEYILAAEDLDGRFKFDIIRIGLHGKVFPPIALIAKTQQASKQEQIRQKLFAKRE